MHVCISRIILFLRGLLDLVRSNIFLKVKSVNADLMKVKINQKSPEF